MIDQLERRLRQFRSRVLIRSWGYRQRHHARGVWFRLSRLLAGTSRAFAVSEDDVRRLCEEGCPVEPVGREVEPPKLIVSAPLDRVLDLASAREVPVALGGALLQSRCLALVPFESRPARSADPI